MFPFTLIPTKLNPVSLIDSKHQQISKKSQPLFTKKSKFFSKGFRGFQGNISEPTL